MLELDFTGAANVADFSAIDGTVRKTILSTLNSMLTLVRNSEVHTWLSMCQRTWIDLLTSSLLCLVCNSDSRTTITKLRRRLILHCCSQPNRYLYKLDTNADYFRTFHYPVGVARITVGQAWGFSEEAASKAKKLFAKITRAAPDCYTQVELGAEEPFRTATINNTHKPAWNETKDFVVSDFAQCITFDVNDHDVNGDDDIGMAVTTVKEIMMAGGKLDLPLTLKHEETGGMVSVQCEFFEFAADTGSISSSDHKGTGRLSGVATVLVAGAYDIEGKRKELTPSVVVTFGNDHRFQTAVKTDAPGTDINNPSFDQAFRVPLTPDIGGSPGPFRLALMNGEKEIGGADVPFADVTSAPEMTLEKTFDVGSGATIRASICVRGLVPGKVPQDKLADRTK